jgi:GNAT superfamily N-acetyltransferase
MQIRDMTSEDIPSLVAMLARTYEESHSASETMALRLRTALACRVKSFVADDGAPAGMVLVYDYGTSSFIALMGVEPSRQRSGVGKAIMAAVCEWLDRKRDGLPSELYATPVGHGLYRGCGFVDEGEAGIWYGRGPGRGDTAGVRLATHRDHDAIAALDHAVFGADRGASFRAALENPANAVFLVDRGFAIAQRSAKVLGPVVAPDEATAFRLLRASADALGEGEHRVNAPVREDVERLLADAGYRRDRTTKRMVRGAVPAGRRDRIYIALNLGQG